MKQKVSVVMTTFNGEKHLREQLDSIFAQTYPLYEVIISDDGSTDGTKEIILQYVNSYPIIKAVDNKGKHGPHGNFAYAFTLASGDIIIPSDQDDIWMTNKVERLVSFFNENIDVVYAQDLVFSSTRKKEPDVYYLPNIDVCIWKNRLKGHTCAFRKELYKLYFESGDVSWDYVIALYSVISGRVIGLPDFLVAWRRHENAVTLQASGITIPEHFYGKYKWTSILKANELLKKKESRSWSFNHYLIDRAHLINYITANYSLSFKKSVLHLYSRVLLTAARQTQSSLFLSGILNAIAGTRLLSFHELSFKEKLGFLSLSFRTPYIEWLATKDFEHLS